MTKQEAIEAMMAGQKVTHRHFTSDEFITMKLGRIVDENGYSFNANQFWSFRTSESFNSDWKIFESKEPEHHTWKCRCGALNRSDVGTCARCRCEKDAREYYND